MLSNIEEVRARGGIVIAVATQGDQEIAKKADHVLLIPDVHEQLVPMVSVRCRCSCWRITCRCSAAVM